MAKVKPDDPIYRHLKTMEDSVKSRNRVSVAEFQRFAPLFDRSITAGNIQDSGYLEELTTEYRARFAPFDPITVVDNEDNVVFECAPMFRRVDTMEEHIANTHELLNIYSNVMTSDSQPPHKKAQVNKQMDGMLKTLIHKSEQNSDKNKHTDELVEGHLKGEAVASAEEGKPAEDWDWE